jgi:hypothetical protein
LGSGELPLFLAAFRLISFVFQYSVNVHVLQHSHSIRLYSFLHIAGCHPISSSISQLCCRFSSRNHNGLENR